MAALFAHAAARMCLLYTLFLRKPGIERREFREKFGHGCLVRLMVSTSSSIFIQGI